MLATVVQLCTQGLGRWGRAATLLYLLLSLRCMPLQTIYISPSRRAYVSVDGSVWIKVGGYTRVVCITVSARRARSLVPIQTLSYCVMVMGLATGWVDGCCRQGLPWSPRL
jgi:hypothetical protein